MKARKDDLTLDLLGDFGTPEAPGNPMEARFWEFHAENPRVYALFDRFTQEVLARGHRRMSADMILHRVRFETKLATSDPEYKINNNYSAYYSRLWMRQNPARGNLFAIRRPLNGDVSDALKTKAA